MDLEFFHNLINNVKESDFVQNFINELSEFIESNSKLNSDKPNNKYSEYWNYQKFMEDNAAANIGISRWNADVKCREELTKAIDDSILELAETEGTLYRKKFTPNGPTNNQTYNIDKFENGNIEHLILSSDEVPKGFENEDIIFQHKEDGNTKVRNDLKQKAIKLASKNLEHLKEIENERAIDYKREGHIYKVVENDGYIFLKDITEERGEVLEDIDFVVNDFQGEGTYQVINGKYQKI